MFSISTKIKIKGQQLLSKRVLYCILLSAMANFLSACSNSPPPPIMTDEKFDTRQNQQGLTEFVYGVSWRHTSQESIVGAQPNINTKEPNRRQVRSGLNEQQAQKTKFDVRANNQTKLELEDKAAQALNIKLRQQQTCLKGYEIIKVIWKVDNIRLFGHCK